MAANSFLPYYYGDVRINPILQRTPPARSRHHLVALPPLKKPQRDKPSQTRGPSIVQPPSDLPPSIGKRAPKHVRIDLEAVELEGQLADGTTYTYMTFNKLVPGPLLRVRVDDTVELHLKNLAANQLTHSIDLHAVTGPGGGSSRHRRRRARKRASHLRRLSRAYSSITARHLWRQNTSPTECTDSLSWNRREASRRSIGSFM